MERVKKRGEIPVDFVEGQGLAILLQPGTQCCDGVFAEREDCAQAG
jgi:hypothetical protein